MAAGWRVKGKQAVKKASLCGGFFVGCAVREESGARPHCIFQGAGRKTRGAGPRVSPSEGQGEGGGFSVTLKAR